MPVIRSAQLGAVFALVALPLTAIGEAAAPAFAQNFAGNELISWSIPTIPSEGADTIGSR